MPDRRINTRVILKHGTEADWKQSSLVPLEGETIIYLPDDQHPYVRHKIGNGETSVNDLPFCDLVGTKTTEEIEVVKDKTITFTADAANGYYRSTKNPFAMNSGFSSATTLYSKYRVIFDNVEYICYSEVGTIVRFDENGELLSSGTYPLLGNAARLGDLPSINDPQLPFCIAVGRDEASALYVYAFNSTATTHKISVYYLNEENNQLPIELIPSFLKGFIYNQETGAIAMNTASQATGLYSLSEGMGSASWGAAAHSEGIGTLAKDNGAHSEGGMTEAIGRSSHAEGQYTRAKARASHTEGIGTEACVEAQHVEGKYNIEDSEGNYVHIIGNGTADNDRSNAHTIDWDGNAWFAGDVTVGEEKNKLVTETDLNQKIGEYAESDTQYLIDTLNQFDEYLQNGPIADAVATKSSVTIGREHQDVFDADTKLDKKEAPSAGVVYLYGVSKSSGQYLVPVDDGSLAAGRVVNYKSRTSGSTLGPSTAGGVLVSGEPAYPRHVATKNYVDNNFIAKSGDSTLDGSLVVTGDLTIEGTTYTQDAQTQLIAENIIELNSNKIDNNTALSGIAINKDENSTYGIMYDPEDDTVKLGLGTTSNGEFSFDENEGEPIAIRDDSSNIGLNHLMSFDTNNNKLIDSGYTAESLKDFGLMKTIVYSGGTFNETIKLGDLQFKSEGALSDFGGGFVADVPVSRYATNDTVYTITLSNVPSTRPDCYISVVTPLADYDDPSHTNNEQCWGTPLIDRPHESNEIRQINFTGPWQVCLNECSGSYSQEELENDFNLYKDINLHYSYSAYNNNMTGPIEEIGLSSDTEVIIEYPIDSLTISDLVSAYPGYNEKWRVSFVPRDAETFVFNMPSEVEWDSIYPYSFKSGKSITIEIVFNGSNWIATASDSGIDDEIKKIKTGAAGSQVVTLQEGQIKTDLNFIVDGRWSPNPGGNYFSGYSEGSWNLTLDDGSGMTVKTWQLKGMWLVNDTYLQILMIPNGLLYRKLYKNSDGVRTQDPWSQFVSSGTFYSTVQHLTSELEKRKLPVGSTVKISGTPTNINSKMGYGNWTQVSHYETYVIDGTTVLTASAGGWVWIADTTTIGAAMTAKYGFNPGIDPYHMGVTFTNGDGNAQGEGCPVGSKWVGVNLYVKFSADTQNGPFRVNFCYTLNKGDWQYSYWKRTS